MNIATGKTVLEKKTVLWRARVSKRERVKSDEWRGDGKALWSWKGSVSWCGVDCMGINIYQNPLSYIDSGSVRFSVRISR